MAKRLFCITFAVVVYNFYRIPSLRHSRRLQASTTTCAQSGELHNIRCGRPPRACDEFDDNLQQIVTLTSNSRRKCCVKATLLSCSLGCAPCRCPLSDAKATLLSYFHRMAHRSGTVGVLQGDASSDMTKRRPYLSCSSGYVRFRHLRNEPHGDGLLAGFLLRSIRGNGRFFFTSPMRKRVASISHRRCEKGSLLFRIVGSEKFPLILCFRHAVTGVPGRPAQGRRPANAPRPLPFATAPRWL